MNILIIGSGGREHALAEAYSKSKKVKKILVVPGNDFMFYQNKKIKIYPDIKVLDYDSILNLAKRKKVNLIDVAQDDPLALGFVDKFKKEGFLVFGPTQTASQIEWSKEWARNFMQKYNLPIPKFKVFNNQNQKKAIEYVENLKEQPLFIKASGLAAGKGAIRADNKEQALSAILAMKQFNNAGKTFLIEECLTGEEFSLFVLCDGNDYKIIGSAQDHKTVYNANQGANTGGMGCVSPLKAINFSTIRTIEQKILKPFLKGMQREKRPYEGVLYVGGIITSHGIKIIEFNARWGDPEAEVIIPSIKTDYLEIVDAVKKQLLSKIKIKFDKKVRISIAGCSLGYPNDYSKVKGKKIFGLEQVSKIKGVKIFGAGIKREGKDFIVNGGRVFHLAAEGKNIIEARHKAYQAISMIYIENNNLHYRTDIGWKEQERLYGII